jgi:hypothetical protein
MIHGAAKYVALSACPDDATGRRRGATGLVPALALAWLGCGGTEGREEPDAAPPADAEAIAPVDLDAGFPAEIGAGPEGDALVRIGSGRYAWEAVVHGDPLTWEAGVQGGYHTWLAVAVDASLFANLAREELDAVRSRFHVRRADGSLLATAWRTGGYRSEEAVGYELFGGFAVLEPGIRPSRLDDEPLRVSVKVEIPGEPTRESYAWLRSACCDDARGAGGREDAITW